MSLVPDKHKTISERSLEVSRTYLQRGQGVTRSFWIRVSPKHPALKVAIAPPMAVLLLTVLVLILIALGFTLLAVALMEAMRRGGESERD